MFVTAKLLPGMSDMLSSGSENVSPSSSFRSASPDVILIDCDKKTDR